LNDGEGQTPTILGDAMPQTSDEGASAQTIGPVKPQGPRLRVEAPSAGSGDERQRPDGKGMQAPEPFVRIEACSAATSTRVFPRLVIRLSSRIAAYEAVELIMTSAACGSPALQASHHSNSALPLDAAALKTVDLQSRG
jgi:hypothetical protein